MGFALGRFALYLPTKLERRRNVMKHFPHAARSRQGN